MNLVLCALVCFAACGKRGLQIGLPGGPVQVDPNAAPATESKLPGGTQVNLNGGAGTTTTGGTTATTSGSGSGTSGTGGGTGAGSGAPMPVVTPPAPTATMTANGTQVSLNVAYGANVTLQWTTTNTTTCSATANGTAIPGNETNKTIDRGAHTGNVVYLLSCTGEGGTTGARVDVVVAAPTDHIIFVSSRTYNGNLGGYAGADAKCQEMAVAANRRPERPWKAILSTFTGHTLVGPVKNTLGGVVKAAGPFGSNLDSPIRYSETGALLLGEDNVWTGFGDSCRGFSSSDDNDEGIVGSTESSNSDWLNDDDEDCDANNRIYCISY